MDKPVTVLFVCSGNTCRSSMAAAIAKYKLNQRNKLNKVKVISAGTAAIDGCPASSYAVKVMKDLNIDLSLHRSKRLTSSMILEADYIFTMTVNQKQQVLSLVPDAAEKVWVLKEFAYSGEKTNFNINDPYGGDEVCYRNCACELEETIDIIVDKVIK